MLPSAARRIYLVMQFMDTDLHRVIQSEQTLSAAHSRHFVLQLLFGIRYMHQCGVLHRDLKPGGLPSPRRASASGSTRRAPHDAVVHAAPLL